MHELPLEAGPWANAAAAAPPAWAADAIAGSVPSSKVEAVSTRRVPPLAAGLLRYGPRVAMAGWLFGVAWMVGSHFVGPARTVVHQDSAQSAEMGPAAQKMADEHNAQKADVEAIHAAQTLSTKDVTGLGSAKLRLDAVKTEISSATPEPSGKVEHLRQKSAEKPSKVGERLDRMGLKIAALLAAAPAADRSVGAAPAARRWARNARHDAFDPSLDPTAPGAPRPLGIIAPAATTRNSAEHAYGQGDGGAGGTKGELRALRKAFASW